MQTQNMSATSCMVCTGCRKH